MSLQALSYNGFVSKSARSNTSETRATGGWWVRLFFHQALGAHKIGGAMTGENAVVVLKGRFAAGTDKTFSSFKAWAKPDFMALGTVSFWQVCDFHRLQSNHFRSFGFSLRFAYA
jgi:hypothetical protein